MRVVFWNILHGGGSRRMPEIALALLGWGAESIVLCEYRTTLGGQLRGVLADHGWEHQVCTDPLEGSNGLLVASRFGIERLARVGDATPQRLVGVRMAGNGPVLMGVHVPPLEAGDGEGQAVWGALLSAAREFSTDRTLIVGDLNAGRRWRDEAGVAGVRRLSREASALRRVGSEGMGRLWLMGYRDAWRDGNGGVKIAGSAERSGSSEPGATTGGSAGEVREFSWFSHEGRGVRIDHALASGGLWPRVLGARYEHAVRESGVSDHAALVVEISETA